jgi:[CysO sulfur-carrier protein]-S-L-cysteine hydrolase
VGSRDGLATTVHPAENLAASPFRFEVDGPALFRLLDEIEGRGDELGAIYHSHTRSEPYPSQTDVNFSGGWPGVEWIIVGTKGDAPTARSFLIEDGVVREIELAVE